MKTIREKVVKARRDYSCSFCQSNIFKGEEYRNSTIVFEDKIYTWRSCNHCKNIIGKMSKEWYPDGIGESEFWNYVEYHDIDFERR